MEELRGEIKAVRESQHRMELVQVEIQKDLGTHMARTQANEERIIYLERIFIGLASAAVLGSVVKLLIG